MNLKHLFSFSAALLLISCGENISGNDDDSSASAQNPPFSTSSSSLALSSSSMAANTGSSSSVITDESLSISVQSAPGVIVSAFLNYPAIAYPNGLVSLKISNTSAQARTYRIKLEILGYSDPLVESVTVPGKTSKIVPLTPVLKAGVFESLTEVKNVSLGLSVQDGNQTLYEQTLKSKLTANNVMAWGYNDKGNIIYYDSLVAGWVTPTAPEIKALIAEAGAYLEDGYAFSGYQKPPMVFMTSMTLDGLCCATDAGGNARDPYFSMTGPGNFSFTSETKDDNAASKLTWTSFVQLSQHGEYNLLVRDEDLSTDDMIWGKSFVLPESFFTSRQHSYTDLLQGISLTAGWQYAPEKQAKAIYEAFKARGLSYVSSSDLDFGLAQGSTYASGEYVGQSIRLPYQSLKNKGYNCIEGAVMFASALENVGIDAFIVLVTGHAYVGWYNMADHSSSAVLETTMIPDADFATAYNKAAKRYPADSSDSQFRIIDIKKSRQAGILPLL